MNNKGYVNIYRSVNEPFSFSRVYETVEHAKKVGSCFSYYLCTISVACFEQFMGIQK